MELELVSAAVAVEFEEATGLALPDGELGADLMATGLMTVTSVGGLVVLVSSLLFIMMSES
tara:strand:- start:149 stop:331 length:183 start_codon:yes stop_codon:yes gene_type:complete